MPKTAYSTEAYWQERYKTTCSEHYEWITKPSNNLTNRISSQINVSSQKIKILQLGSGSSAMNQKIMTAIKRKKVQQNEDQDSVEFVSIDFCKEIVKKTKNKNTKGLPIRYLCMDVRNMKAFQNEEYDIIVDKGTMDCLFCEDNFIKEVLKGMRECFRVLKDGGKMFIFSHGKPKFRHYLFRNKLVPFSIEYEIFERNEVIGKDKSVYLYKLTKGGSSNVIEQNQQQEEEEQEKKEGEERQEDIIDKVQEEQYEDDQMEDQQNKEEQQKQNENNEGQFNENQEKDKDNQDDKNE